MSSDLDKSKKIPRGSLDDDTASEGKPPVPKPTRSVPKPPSQNVVEAPPDTAAVLKEIFETPEPHERRRHVMLGVASAVIAIAGILIALFALRGTPVVDPAVTDAEPSASIAPAPAEVTPSASTSASAAVSTSATSVASEAPPPKSRVVTFHAAAEMKKLRYGTTTIAVTPPRGIVVLTVIGEEDLPVEAVTVDGRILTATLHGSSTNVTLKVGGALPSPGRRKK